MANIKMTIDNYDDILEDMASDSGTSRTDTYYFSPTELNESTIRQLAWTKNLILNISSIDSFVSKVIYSDILN